MIGILEKSIFKMGVEDEELIPVEDLGIDYESLVFAEADDMKEAKILLKEGTGVKIDRKRGIYYCENCVKLFLLVDEYSDEEIDIEDIDTTDLTGREITIVEAEELLVNIFETKRQESNRKKEYNDWLKG